MERDFKKISAADYLLDGGGPMGALALDGATNLPALQRMAVRVGKLGLLFPLHGGREVLPRPAVSRIPNTAPWLLGLANIRGGLVPVIDTAAAFDMPRRASVPPYLHVFGHRDAAIGLLIDELPRLFYLDNLQQLDKLPAMPRLLRGSGAAAYEQDHRIWIDVDLDRLFDALSCHIAL